MNRITLTVTSAEEGLSIEQLLRRKLKLSGARIRSLKFASEGICVNGKKARTSVILHEGDRLEVLREDPPARTERLKPAAPTGGSMPEIVYEDESLIVVNKPAGLVMHPAGGHRTDTLANQLRAYLDARDPAARVHFAGRLDKDTSGLVLCAKNAHAAQKLQKEKARGGFEKTYLALAAGDFAAGEEKTVSLPLAPERDPVLRIIRMKADPAGKPALTLYQVVRAFPGYALLEIRLGSGRTHQIRAHMAVIRHPLLGDPLYGDKEINHRFEDVLSRTALHAAELRFPHPEDGRQMTLSAPLPADMAGLLAAGSSI
ncbi:MAG: RluA family pseudouridine synthase [Lachnospiraceae bacterium]|nr:RluA family pseudouridine synthase [Lachnospiraceae bacterium]